MRRFPCILISVILLGLLAGCQTTDNNLTKFYYCRDPQSSPYFEEDCIIHSEMRDLTGHRKDLQYMLGLYLAGPMDEGFIIPFSKQTRLLSVQQEGTEILIELSDHTKSLSDSDFSLSCACLTLTCMDFTQCQSVTISSGERTVIMNRDNIILQDTLPQQEKTGG